MWRRNKKSKEELNQYEETANQCEEATNINRENEKKMKNFKIREDERKSEDTQKTIMKELKKRLVFNI